MNMTLASYCWNILQFFIIAVLIITLIVLVIKAAFYLLESYQRARFLYEQYKEGNLNNIIKKEKEAKKGQKKSHYVLYSLLIVSVAAILFIGLAYFAHKTLDLKISSDHVVITFVGIIATFVVVTNYAQVADIKKETEDRLSQFDKDQLSYVRKLLREIKKNRRREEEEENNNGEF